MFLSLVLSFGLPNEMKRLTASHFDNVECQIKYKGFDIFKFSDGSSQWIGKRSITKVSYDGDTKNLYDYPETDWYPYW